MSTLQHYRKLNNLTIQRYRKYMSISKTHFAIILIKYTTKLLCKLFLENCLKYSVKGRQT